MTKLYHMVKTLIIRSFRDVSTNIILIAMPLALIFILGTTFSNASSQSRQLSDMTIHVSDNGVNDFADGMIEVLEGIISSESKIIISDYESSKPLLENNQITCFIEVDELNKKVTIYKNQIINFDSTMIEGVIRTYTNRANTIYTIAMVDFEYLSEIDDSDIDITQKVGLSESVQVTTKDYYGIAMVILFVLYGAMTPAYEILSDRSRGLLNRMDVANVKPLTVLSSKIIGYTIVSAIRVFVVVALSSLISGIYWGANPFLSFGYILCFLTTITALGVAVGYTMKDITHANSTVHIFIVFSAFMGGTYIQTDNIPILKDLGRFLSINWWANKGLMNYIFSNDTTILFQGFVMCTVITLCLGVIGIYSIGKGEKRFDR